jgi:hypothetical protein
MISDLDTGPFDCAPPTTTFEGRQNRWVAYSNFIS